MSHPISSVLRIASLAVIFITLNTSGQDQLGIAGSNYSPVNTIWNNPSTIVDSKAFLDIQLAGAGVFGRNNLAYLPGGSFSFRNPENTPLPSYKRDNAPYLAYADVEVWGPSATFAVKQHAFGILSRFRTVADVRGLPESLGYYLTEGFQYSEQMGIQHTVKDARLGGLSWGEVGISYGTIVSRSGAMITQAGVAVRRMIGVMGAGMRVDDWSYVVLDSNNMRALNFQGEYGFNDPGIEPFNWNNGGGWGVDLGLTFKQRLRSSENYTPHDPCSDGNYRYRLGFSVLDIGRIRFRGPFYRNILNETEQNDWNDFGNTQVNDLQGLDSLLNSGLLAAQDNSDQQRFTMMLPTAFSAQFDYNLNHGFYVHSVITAGVPWRNRLGVQRSSYLGVIPRWEKKRVEVALPVSLFEFRYPQVGAMIRLNSLIIGSDNLGGLLFRRNVFGADVYVSLKYTVFRHWKCNPGPKKTKMPRRRMPKTPLPCPVW
ncbi:MAG: DUF5723 family protein [Flavobacteriales bacterium]